MFQHFFFKHSLQLPLCVQAGMDLRLEIHVVANSRSKTLRSLMKSGKSERSERSDLLEMEDFLWDWWKTTQFRKRKSLVFAKPKLSRFLGATGDLHGARGEECL